MLVAVTLLNKTSGKLALPIFWEIISKWPTALHLSKATIPELVCILRRIGMQTVRAKRLVALSSAYLADPPSVYDPRPSRDFNSPPRTQTFEKGDTSCLTSSPISHLPGVGRYALDSYRIFCMSHDDPKSGEWKKAQPSDKQLALYLKWKWAVDEHMQWHPTNGATGPIDADYTHALIEELEDKL
ncbi:hypothetical protein CVT24_008080 [Panaeolus cyanescens]|uniref:HhH-GPD domain-containing protein n=1 Tax=Panaeolus cyanescens TaxID=181874 RepID=A0A409W0L0_9AGAR|nr:hypothetical protein CVT24_008080 [Panaeolus cyanescens]